MMLSWSQAAGLAILLGCLALPLRRWARAHSEQRPGATRRTAWVSAALLEIALVLGLFAVWQLGNRFGVVHVAGAFDHARQLLRAEHLMRLPSELDVQHLVVPHPALVRVCNVFYATVHFPAMIAFLVWLWLRHRDRYPRWRTVVVLFTAAALLIQLVPVAPPRMLPQDGFVDTALAYGQSVYGAFGSGIAAQLAPMPSVHVGWAVLIAAAVITVSGSRWRWLVLAHPVTTTFVVVATANHYWMDGIVAALLVALAVLATGPLPRTVRSWRVRRAGQADVPRRTTSRPSSAAAPSYTKVTPVPAQAAMHSNASSADV